MEDVESSTGIFFSESGESFLAAFLDSGQAYGGNRAGVSSCAAIGLDIFRDVVGFDIFLGLRLSL